MSTETTAPPAPATLSPHDAAAMPIKVAATWGCLPGHANVVVHLTRWAPGFAEVPANSGTRWRTWLNASPRYVMSEVLALVRRAPDQVTIGVCSAGYVEVLGAEPGEPKALALVWEVMPAAAEQARFELDRGLRPIELTPANDAEAAA